MVEARTSLSENGDDHCGPPAGIEIGAQAGTPLFHNFDMKSDDTNTNNLSMLTPITKYVSPAPVVVCDNYVAPAPVIEYMSSALVIEYVVPALAVNYVAPAPVIDNMSSAPVNEYVAPAPAVTPSVPSQQLHPAYTMTTVTTDDNFEPTDLVNTQFSIPAVEALVPTGRWFTSSFRRVSCARVQPNPSGTGRRRDGDPAKS